MFAASPLLLGAALLTACAATAERPPATGAPTTPNVPAELTEPWLPPGEPVDPTASAAVTLNQLLVYADANAPIVQTARARVGLADARVTAASITVPANPQVSVGVGQRTVGDASGVEYEIGLQQQLEIAGQPGLRQDAAQATRRARQARVNEVRWAIHVEVHRLYVGLLLAAERRA